MGLLLGRPDTENPRRIIVTDAYPIDADGFETQVATDDDRVMTQMIDVSDQIEFTRKEKIMGWCVHVVLPACTNARLFVVSHRSLLVAPPPPREGTTRTPSTSA